MAETTQFDFDTIIHGSVHGNRFLLFERMVICICITTGIREDRLLSLEWRKLISIGSDNEPYTVEYISSPDKYPLHPRIRQIIVNAYTSLNRPSLNSKIIEAIPQEKRERFIEWAYRIIASDIRTENPYDDSRFKDIDFKTVSQRLFANKIIECCGYNTDTCTFLKGQFGFRNNRQLLDLLGYSSKDEIKYELYKVNLDKGKAFLNLKDQNFNSKPSFPFQKFSSFANFLKTINTRSLSQIGHTMANLLAFCLYNGRKPVFFLGLDWSHLTEYDPGTKIVKIKRYFTYRSSTYKIPEYLLQALDHHLEEKLEKLQYLIPKTDNNKVRHELVCVSEPELNIPVFITNTGVRLVQQSLNRELKSFFKAVGFTHFNKFVPNSTCIMYGRRMLEIKGNHLPTIQALKKHFNFKSTKELLKFLFLDNMETGFMDREPRKFHAIMYDIADNYTDDDW